MSNKYLRVIRGKDILSQEPRQMLIDVFCVYRAFDVNAVLANAVKKILCSGSRGYKDEIQDLQEAVRGIERYIEQLNIDKELDNE